MSYKHLCAVARTDSMVALVDENCGAYMIERSIGSVLQMFRVTYTPNRSTRCPR